MIYNWDSFKTAVDLEWGVTKEEETAAFYAMAIGEGEDASTFVLRVESTRKVVGVPGTGLEHVFTPRLPAAFRLELEQTRKIAARAG